MQHKRDYLLRETRVAMVADYLLDKPLLFICEKYSVCEATIIYWVKRHGDHFKLRKPRKKDR